MHAITPTIGRKVWFRPNGVKNSLAGVSDGGVHEKRLNVFNDQPLDATVVCVWGDRMVNLLVVDHGGETHALRSVDFRQPDDPTPQNHYCEWMPYQVGQAKQAADVGTTGG